MARVLACGAFLKNAACLLDTSAPDAWWSANHGDLSDPQACLALGQAWVATRSVTTACCEKQEGNRPVAQVEYGLVAI